MTALAAPWSERERGGLLRWVLPASVALHVGVFASLPSSSRSVALPPPPLVLEVVDPPPPPPAPPKPEEVAPEPEAHAAPPPLRTASPSRTVPSAPARTTNDPPVTAPASEAPMDFTSTVFSNDGPGLAVGGGGPRVGATAAAGPARSVAPAAPPPPRVVPPSSLARRPRAPGLDAELERQYPAEARRSGISGSAVLRVRILPDGRIGEVRIMSESWTGFGPACERTVRAARWEPPIDRDGTPVATEITYTCRFEVRS